MIFFISKPFDDTDVAERLCIKVAFEWYIILKSNRSNILNFIYTVVEERQRTLESASICCILGRHAPKMGQLKHVCDVENRLHGARKDP